MNQENLLEVVATDAINADMPTAAEILEMEDTAYSGSVMREVWKDVMDNVASNLAQKDVRLVDIFHDMNGDSFTGFTGMVYGAAQTTMSDGQTLGQHVRHIEGQAFDALEKLTTDFCGVRKTSPRGGKQDLAEAAQAMVYNRLIKPSFYGGRAEAVSGHSLVENANAEDFAVHSDRITEMLGIENPEARGIDMLVLWEDGTASTAQVKYGPGGQMPDTCEADILIRYEEPADDDRTTVVNPMVKVYDIPADE